MMAGQERATRRARRALRVPLRITAWLQAPVVGDPLLPIDAVLYYAAHREMLGARVVSRSGGLTPSEGERVPTLPLSICAGETPHWYYAASSAIWSEPYADGVDHWTCRFDSQWLHLIDLPTGRLNTASGRYRGYHMPVYYRAARSVRWYVVGEHEAIMELLCGVSHIGKKTSQGWGAVLGWEVERVDHDWSVTGPQGERMRPIPDPVGEMRIGYRPPYWLPSRQTLCLMPAEARAVTATTPGA